MKTEQKLQDLFIAEAIEIRGMFLTSIKREEGCIYVVGSVWHDAGEGEDTLREVQYIVQPNGALLVC